MFSPSKKEMENRYNSMMYQSKSKNNYITKLKYLYLDPKRVIKSLIRRTKEIFYYVSLPLMLHFSPSYIYLLINFKEKFMPKKNEKLLLKKNFEDDFFYKKQNKIYHEINIILRGGSLEKNIKKIDFSLPTFQVNFPKQLVKKYKPIHVTADGAVNNILIKKTKGPVIFFRQARVSKKNFSLEKKNKIYINTQNKMNKNDLKKLNIINKLFCLSRNGMILGSAMVSIIILGGISSKVNIFGWDYFQNEKIHKFNYLKLLFLLNPKDGHIKGTRTQSRAYHESMYTWYYTYRLSIQKKYNVVSFLSNIKKRVKIIKKIEKAYFK